MTLKTSLIIAGDTSGAIKAVVGLAQEMDKLGSAGTGASQGLVAADRAQNEVAASAKAMATAEAEAQREIAAVAMAAREASGAVVANTAAFKQHTQASNDNAASAQRHAFGVRNLGQQFGDLAVMVGGGIDPLRAFATQAGQMGYAASEMGGKIGAVGAFLTGPWGIALTVAFTALAPFVSKLFEGGDAADSAGEKAKSLTDSIKELNKALDQTTRTQTRSIELTYAQAEGLRQQAIKTQQARIAALQLAEAQYGQAQSMTFGAAGGAGAGMAVAAYASQVGQVRKALQEANRDLSNAQDAVRKASIPVLDARAVAATDANAAATRRHEQALNRLRDAYLKTGNAAAYARGREAEERTYRDDRERIQAAGRASNKSPSRAGERAAAAAARRIAATAAAETRELDGLVRQLTTAFDPGQRAADAYRKSLEDIAKVVDSGRLSPAKAIAYEAGALQQYREAAAQAERESFQRVFADSIVEANRDLDAMVQATTDSFRERLDGGAKAAGKTLRKGVDEAGASFRDAIGDVGELLGINLGGLISQLQGSGKRATDYGAALAPQIEALGRKIGFTEDKARLFGTSIGTKAGQALAGAQDGRTIAGIVGALGIKSSNTGGAIGGAIGGLTGIPGGQIIGSVLGSIVGGLFKKSPKGAVSITGTDSSSYSGSGKLADGLNSSASSVQGSLAQIAQQLGGSTGGFSVAIGKNGDWYHVAGDAGADVAAKHPKSPLLYEGKDEAAALAAALGNAIADGAILGISPKVAQALQSSPDINKALKEALSVQSVEMLTGGVLAEYQKAFRDFEATAKERVRIASQYGFDVLAIEQRNAADRTKLADQLAASQTGSLKTLVDQLTSGSLFEGSALDKIAALNTAIGKARADLDANVEGAGDRLATLYEQRLDAAKSAYGTTGAYAADRTSVIAEAQAAIARTNAQIVQAQSAEKASDPALATTNAALDENNDQNARLIAAMETNNDLLSKLYSSQQFAGGFDLAKLGSY